MKPFSRLAAPGGFAALLGFSLLLVATTGGRGSNMPIGEPTAIPRPDKAAIQAKIDALREEGAKNRAPKGGSNPNDQDLGEPILPEGGVPLGPGLLFSDEVLSTPPNDSVDTFTTAWSLIGKDLNIDVWAGARGDDVSQGLVILIKWDSARAAILDGGSYDAPMRDGALRITAAEGEVLTLTAADGKQLEFDLVVIPTDVIDN